MSWDSHWQVDIVNFSDETTRRVQKRDMYVKEEKQNKRKKRRGMTGNKTKFLISVYGGVVKREEVL